YRNVRAFNLPQEGGSNAVLRKAEELLISEGFIRKGDLIIVTWGSPMGEAGGTNALKIVRAGDRAPEYD
ncbi:pyruvate kinase, partial [Acinetobacter baumannii]|nr:pyruvate kinase [Acinetobacter baumannii]